MPSICYKMQKQINKYTTRHQPCQQNHTTDNDDWIMNQLAYLMGFYNQANPAKETCF